MPFDKKAYHKEYMRAWREKNREHDKAYMKAYRDNNRERIKEYNKQWRMDNVEATYAHCNTPRQKQSRWKKQGIHCDDEWDEVYDWYSNTTNCDICDKLFVKSIDKCLDHDHHLEGYNVRGILCQKCNNYRNEI